MYWPLDVDVLAWSLHPLYTLWKLRARFKLLLAHALQVTGIVLLNRVFCKADKLFTSFLHHCSPWPCTQLIWLGSYLPVDVDPSFCSCNCASCSFPHLLLEPFCSATWLCYHSFWVCSCGWSSPCFCWKACSLLISWGNACWSKKYIVGKYTLLHSSYMVVYTRWCVVFVFSSCSHFVPSAQ